MSLNFKKELVYEEKHMVIERFIECFAKSEKKLIWNNFIKRPRCFPFEQFNSLEINKSKNVYFYLERVDRLFITQLDCIKCYVDELEPWIDIDAYVFDESMEWTVAITHEDNKIFSTDS